jgi:hypothetical protein
MRTRIRFRNSVRYGSVGIGVLRCLVILPCQPSSLTRTENPHETHHPRDVHGSLSNEARSTTMGPTTAGWDGSPEGKACSEFNHRLSGALVVIIGLGELHGGLGTALLSWMRFLLPGAPMSEERAASVVS